METEKNCSLINNIELRLQLIEMLRRGEVERALILLEWGEKGLETWDKWRRVE